jgi:sterol desaturase/sphingolipid hydroxylase (fatty acid hydroxylase superfamily)
MLIVFVATHVTHHNSKKYNLSVAFLGWATNIKFIFYSYNFNGFDPVLFLYVPSNRSTHQFWIHTEYIRKLPAPIEYIFVTPSHHRVHHSTNDQYIDKNF